MNDAEHSAEAARYDAGRVCASIVVDVSADTLFRIWAEVESWHLWDPDTRQATLDGPAALGRQGSLTPAKGRRVPMLIDAFEPGKCLKVRCPVLGSALHFDHRLEIVSAQRVRATHEAWFTGWAAPLLRAMLRRQLQRNLPETMASLKRYAESGLR